MAEILIIWILVMAFVYYAIIVATDTIAITRKEEISFTKFVAKAFIMTIFVGASPAMIYQAIVGDIHFFDIFLESGLKTIFYLLIISVPLHLVIFRKSISENIRKAATNISYN
ncbi:MAG: hypothetical protein KAI71_03845 [Candidatus Pacebacteria bacterium]|nr:hypothetical protein [Candidatus Paceibacterota bacterium]